MEIVQLDAKKIMAHPEPITYLASRFGVQASALDQLHEYLVKDATYRQVEVYHWPASQESWQALADMLEDVQQKSEYFFLVWGANDKWENKES